MTRKRFPVYSHGFPGSLRLVWLLSLSTMGKNCIAFGCHNTHQKGFSLFKFPTNDKLRKAWTLEVQRTRDKWHGPTKNSAVCSEHFVEDCFESTSVMSKLMGIKMRQMLKSNAIPTIFKRPSATPKRLRVSSATEKRSRARVIHFIFCTVIVP